MFPINRKWLTWSRSRRRIRIWQIHQGSVTSIIQQSGRVILHFLHFLEHKKTNIHTLTRQDISKFVAYEQDRDRALILLLLRTGIRIGELLEVQVSDISVAERKIMIYLGEKNFQGRAVYYSEDAKQALKKWLTDQATQHPSFQAGQQGEV